MNLKVLNIKDVAESHLCCGCGVCGYLDPRQVTMVDDLDAGRRPHFDRPPAATPAHAEALAACPGRQLDRDQTPLPGRIETLWRDWGPVLAVFEGHAADAAVRYAGSSGGVATALAAYAMEHDGMAGTLHIAARADVPYLNETVLSTTRRELLTRTGSRYAPASPCDRLDLVEAADAPCVLIGKPCDIAAAWRARRGRPELDARLGLTIAVFCAGTPTTRGTLAVLDALGVVPDAVTDVRYRGNGWPGEFTARTSDEACSMSYARSWGDILQKHRQWRCYVCPDHTGEFADVAVGDPWHTPPDGTNPGSSLVLARTPCGLRMIERAMRAGAVMLSPVDPSAVPRAQPHLRKAKAAVWLRVTVMRCMGAAVPRFTGFGLARSWWSEFGLVKKIRALAATPVRVARHGVRRRRAVVAWSPGHDRTSAGRRIAVGAGAP